MCEKKCVSISELILAAICYLQEKNGVTACEIAEFVAKKRGCKMNQIEDMIKLILCKAKNNGILNEKKGMFRIEERYDDPPAEDKAPVEIAEESDDSESDDDEEGNEDDKNKCDPCANLKLSQEFLKDNPNERKRCGEPLKKKEKRKC